MRGPRMTAPRRRGGMGHRMKKRKRIAIILAAVAAYIVLVIALRAVESTSPDASITSVPLALWYTLTTLTTVGYGDVYPVTAAGKIIGAIFQFLSVGLLVFLIGLAAATLREKLPKLQLAFRRRQPWYIFTSDNSSSKALARGIREEEPEAVIIYSMAERREPGSLSVALDPAGIAACQKGLGRASIFCMSDNFMENETAARELAGLPCEVYCLSEYDPPARPKLSVFDPYSGCARLYWQRFPVASARERIVLIGGGKYACALLEKALQHNVIDAPERLEYRVFGDFAEFRREHPCLDRVFAVRESGCGDANRDTVIFAGEPWDRDFDVLCRADRIIICYDAEDEALDVLTRLRKYVPAACPVYARLSAELDGVIAFGREEEIFSPELVMRKKLDATAGALHAAYLQSQPQAKLPSWEELAGFTRESNRAAADHLTLKARILLGQDGAADGSPAKMAAGGTASSAVKTGRAGAFDAALTPELCRKAYEVFCAADEQARARYRRIEHDRWARFHVLHNWQYAPVRDNEKRLHPLLVPFDELSPEEQAKDDYGWELLGQLGGSTPEKSDPAPDGDAGSGNNSPDKSSGDSDKREKSGKTRLTGLFLPLLLLLGLGLTACGGSPANANGAAGSASDQSTVAESAPAETSGSTEDNASGPAEDSSAGAAETASEQTSGAAETASEQTSGSAEAETTSASQPDEIIRTGKTWEGANFGDLKKEEMGRLCLYRVEKDETFESDLAIVEGRIDALTGGRYLMEEVIIPRWEEEAYGVIIYLPGDAYGDRTLQDLSRTLINRPINLWIGSGEGSVEYRYYSSTVPVNRSDIESAEVMFGCPPSVLPLDYGIEEEEFRYIKITLTEEFCEQNPQIWEWEFPGLIQDMEGFEGYSHVDLAPDQENRCFYWLGQDLEENYCNAFAYAYTHEPLAGGFYFWALPMIEWDSGDAVCGTCQIENDAFQTASVINVYKMKEAACSDEDWQQTLTAIRERLDAAGITYALGHLPENDRSIVIRSEDGAFTNEMMGLVVAATEVTLTARSEEKKTDLSEIALSVGEKNGEKVLEVDMSALRKETLNKLSALCEKYGGRIGLFFSDNFDSSEIVFAWTECEEEITDGHITLDMNGYTGEAGFYDELENLPEFAAALVNGTPFPTSASGTAAVTLQQAETVWLSPGGELWVTETPYFSRGTRVERASERLKKLEPSEVYFSTNGLMVANFPDPAGENRCQEIAKTLSKAFRLMKDEIFTYEMYFIFRDPDGNQALRVYACRNPYGDTSKMTTYIYYVTESQKAAADEIVALLKADPKLTDLYATND